MNLSANPRFSWYKMAFTSGMVVAAGAVLGAGPLPASSSGSRILLPPVEHTIAQPTAMVGILAQPEVSRAKDLLFQVDALDPTSVTPVIAMARDDLREVLTAYIDQQEELERSLAEDSPSLEATDQITPSQPVAPEDFATPSPTSPTQNTVAPIVSTPPTPSLPAEPSQVAAAAAVPSEADEPAQESIPAPDGSTSEEIAAGTAARGIVRLVDVVTSADRLAHLLNVAVVVPVASVPEAVVAPSLAEQLALAVAQYGSSLDGYSNGRIPADVLCGLSFAPGHLLRCDAAERLNTLAVAFQQEFGHQLKITDSYRSWDEQVAVWQMKPGLAAKPGTSQHGWGLAVDFGGTVPSGTSAEYVWLRTHGPEYGWDNPQWARPSGTKPEPWHFEFFAAGTMPTRYTPDEPLVPPVTGPAPAPQPAPAPSPTPAPAPEPAPAPSPTPSPSPTPAPAPSPSPTPAPSPTPTPTPAPNPTPSPTAPLKPEPAPEPTHDPDPEPTQEPEPSPEPSSDATSDPGSDSQG